MKSSDLVVVKGKHAHRIAAEVMRRMPKSVCRPETFNRSKPMHAVRKGGYYPPAIREVPAVKAAEPLPVPIPPPEPIRVDGRDVVRCPECSLNQFQTSSGNCRKCKSSLTPPRVEAEQATMTRGKASIPEPSSGIDIAFSINFLRRCNRLSQRQLAERMRVPRTYVSKVENRAAMPTLSSIVRFCEALECTPFAFMLIAQSEKIKTAPAEQYQQRERAAKMGAEIQNTGRVDSGEKTNPRPMIQAHQIEMTRSYSHIYSN